MNAFKKGDELVDKVKTRSIDEKSIGDCWLILQVGLVKLRLLYSDAK